MLHFLNSIPLWFYVLGTIVNFTSSFLLGTFLLIKTYKLNVNRLFAFVCYSVAFWSLFFTFSLISINKEQSLFFLRTCMIGVPFIQAFFLHFICRLVKENRYDKIILINYLITILLSFFVYTNLFASAHVSYGVIKYWLKAGPVLTISIIQFIGFLIFAYFILSTKIRETKGFLRNQYIYVFISTMIGYFGGITNYCGWYEINLPPFLNIFTSVYVIAVTYTIIKYRLMDIDLAWRYILSYILYALITFFVFIGFLISSFLYLSKTLAIISNSIILFFSILAAPYFHKKLTIHIKPAMLGKKYAYWDEMDNMIKENGTYTGKIFVYRLVDKIIEIMKLENIQLFMFKENLQKFRLVKQGGISLNENTNFDSEDPIVKLLKGQRTAIYKEDIISSKVTYKPKEILKTLENIHSEIVFPLFVEGTMISIFSFGKKQDGTLFHKEDIQKLIELMMLAEKNLTVEITSRKEFFRIHDKYQVHLLNAIKQIGEVKNLNKLSEPIAQILMRSMHTDHVAIYLYDPEEFAYTKRSSSKAYEELREEIDEDHYLMRLVYEQGEPLIYKDIKSSADKLKSKDIQSAEALARELKARIIAPITHNRLLGFIVLGEKNALEIYGRNDYNTLNLVTYSMSTVIQNILFSEEVVRDSLTGLYNKKAFSEKLPELIANSIRTGQALSLMVIDADKFKNINDTYGHPVGDKVLKGLTKSIRGMIRPFDTLFRYGGEELVIVSANTDLEGASVLGKRLLSINISEVIERIKEECKIDQDITISIGVSSFKPRLDEVDHLAHDLERIGETLVKQADESLYQAKNTGRNKVCLSEQIIDTKEFVYEWSKKKVKRKKEISEAKKRLTVFFSDVAGFSDLSSKVDLDILSNMMNDYIEEMNVIAVKYGGKVLKVMGDGILIVFGEEGDKPEISDAVNCLKMGIEMQERMKELNKNWFEKGIDAEIGIRIGINTGLVKSTEVLGEKDIMSLEVNIASKIENFCVIGKLLISHSTWGLTKDRIKSNELGAIEVKGLPKKIKVYEVDPALSPLNL